MPKLQWVAQYDDGSKVGQFYKDETTGEVKERSYEHLERDRVRSFALFESETLRVVITLHLDPGQKLIYRRRTEMNAAKGVVEVCHLVGWRKTIAGECVQSIAYVFEEMNRIELAGAFRTDHPWFYSPKLRPFEE